MTGVQTCALPICFPVTIGNGKCVYVSAMWNELCVDAIDMTADWSNKYNLPLPSDEELKHYA